MPVSRRQFIMNTAAAAAGSLLAPAAFAARDKKPFFTISLAQWSLHKQLFAKEISTLDFPRIAKQDYDISVVEYVNQFFPDKAKDTKYLADLMRRCNDNGVKNHLIMVDREGDLGSPDQKERAQAVENHYKWVDAAKYLGCITIRVNALGTGSAGEVQKAATESLGKLSEYAAKQNINVIVENHGSYTSNGKWLLKTVADVKKKNVGILPDFGNMCVRRDTGDLYKGKCIDEYDKYLAVQEWMPYAKGVSAKTFDFDASGNCAETDYFKMFDIIKKSGWHGYAGIEYEGETLGADEGIRKTKALLQRVLAQMG